MNVERIKAPLCVTVFRCLGPHHVARLRAFSALLPDLRVVEVAGRQQRYPWQAPDEAEVLKLQTLFPHRDCESIGAHHQAEAIKDVLRRTRPEALILSGYGDPAMRTVVKWARKQGISTVLLWASTIFDKPRIWWKELSKRYLTSFYSVVAVAGERSEAYARSLGVSAARIVRIGNVVDNDYFMQASGEVLNNAPSVRCRLHLPDHYFLTVCRLSPEKNLIGLLKSYEAYRRQGGSWELVLVGAGPEEHHLQEVIMDRSLEGVHLRNWASYQDLPLYYALASCFLLPSLSEPWGIVVNEAMACGLPVLVSDRCGCVPELCREGVNGYTFDPESAVQLSKLMLKLSGAEVDLPAMGDASRHIVSRFTPRSWACGLQQAVDICVSSK